MCIEIFASRDTLICNDYNLILDDDHNLMPYKISDGDREIILRRDTIIG